LWQGSGKNYQEEREEHEVRLGKLGSIVAFRSNESSAPHELQIALSDAPRLRVTQAASSPETPKLFNPFEYHLKIKRTIFLTSDIRFLYPVSPRSICVALSFQGVAGRFDFVFNFFERTLLVCVAVEWNIVSNIYKTWLTLNDSRANKTIRKKKIEMPAKHERTFVIRCPLHGFVKLYDWEREIINHSAFGSGS
jgi:hypothetical protein